MNLLFTSLAAYPFAKMKFRGRDAIFYLLLATFIVPPQLTFIPSYVLAVNASSFRVKRYFQDEQALAFSVDAAGVIHAANPGKHRVERYARDGRLLGHLGRFDGQGNPAFIGAEAARLLRDLDKIAYVRFASVYRDFQDEQAFLNELKNLARQKLT